VLVRVRGIVAGISTIHFDEQHDRSGGILCPIKDENYLESAAGYEDRCGYRIMRDHPSKVIQKGS
jgi:hypothetical protein